MKILWIEDFNGGNSSDSKSLYLTYFKLNETDMIIKENFLEALEYIKNERDSFDLVLLDINLKPRYKEDGEKLYDDFFKGITTKTFFDEHFSKDDGGVLLYLYLREYINFPKNRIAFLSAYVGEQDPLNLEGTGLYDYGEDDDGFLSGSNPERIETLEEENFLKSVKSKESLKIFGEFESIGIPVMHLYRKPQSSTKIGERIPVNANNFQDKFIKGNETDYILFRRNIMEMANILMETYSDFDEPDKKWAKDDVPPLEKFVHIRYNKTAKVGNKVIVLKTFFNTSKPDKAIGIGTENYSSEYFYSLLEKTLELPLVPNTDEERALLNYMRELLFCADCFNIPAKPEEQKNHFFDLAAANVLIKARHGLSHGSATLNSEYTDGLMELKSFLVPLFFRIVFKIDMIPNENREKYLKLERKLLEANGKLDNVKNEVIFETTQNKVLELFRELCADVIHAVKKSDKEKKEKKVFASDVDYSLRSENNKKSFGQFFLTRLLPVKREMQTSGRKAEYVIKVTLTDNLKDISDDSMEALYVQKAYQIGFGSESK